MRRPSFLPEIITLEEIASRLAKLCRFAGGCHEFYSVAQHSVLVAEALADDPKTALYGLVHDAHEAWMSDIPAVVVAEIGAATEGPGAGAFNPVTAIKHACDAAILPALGLEWAVPLAVAARVKDADARAFLTEERDIATPLVVRQAPSVNPFAKPIAQCWPWPKAEEKFIECFDRFAVLTDLPPRKRRAA